MSGLMDGQEPCVQEEAAEKIALAADGDGVPAVAEPRKDAGHLDLLVD